MSFLQRSLPELRDLVETTIAVAAAADVGLFHALADGPVTRRELTGRLGLNTRAVDMLLPVLADLGAVALQGEVVALTEPARRRLADPSSPEYLAGGLPHWLHTLEAWVQLPGALRTGKPPSARPDAPDPEDLARFMAAMASAPQERVDRIVDACLGRRPDARRVLDLGGGPGHFSKAFARRGLNVTLLDTPDTVHFVRDAYGLSRVKGLSLFPGDFLADPLPAGPFDVVIMSNVLHIYSPPENRLLLRKVADVTEPGGIVAIADFIRGRSPTAARFALVMLLRTEGGNSYRAEEFEGWLEATGFEGVEITDLDPGRHVITAVRRPTPG